MIVYKMEMTKEKGEDMSQLPKDPVMLLSYVNTQLRDFYPSLAEFCAAMQTDESDLREKLALIDYEEFCSAADVPQEDIIKSLERISYTYDRDKNQFA
mgnify:CR=1 FL=1